MFVRVLGEADAAMFRDLRVRALRDHPEAFGRTPDELDPVEVLAKRFRQDVDSDLDFMLGAFEEDALVRTTGRGQRNCWQMYVKAAILLAGFAGSYVLLVFGAQTWWQGLLLAMLLGLFAAETRVLAWPLLQGRCVDGAPTPRIPSCAGERPRP